MMHANLQRDSRGDLTIRLKGGLDYDNTILLREELIAIFKKHTNIKITIDMGLVDFVGSSGIAHFVETIKMICEKKSNLRLSNVKEEFVKVFKLYNFANVDSIIERVESDELSAAAELPLRKTRVFNN